MAHRLLAILGPTGSGKSDLAIRLARRHDGEIISADARQVYVGMDIGTAKLGKREMRNEKQDRVLISHFSFLIPRDEPVLITGIPHFLIDILTPDQTYSAAEFRNDALHIMHGIRERGRLPIVVGGTGQYVRTLTEGLSLSGVRPDAAFRTWAEAQPLSVLVAELSARAPDIASSIDNRNRRRVTRALEVVRAGGTLSRGRKRPTFSMLKIALTINPEELRRRLAERVDRQLAAGLIEEVRALVERYGSNAPGLQAIAHREVFPFFAGTATLSATRDAIIQASWRYVRRQMTWLRREPRLVWVRSPDEAERMVIGWLERAHTGK